MEFVQLMKRLLLGKAVHVERQRRSIVKFTKAARRPLQLDTDPSVSDLTVFDEATPDILTIVRTQVFQLGRCDLNLQMDDTGPRKKQVARISLRHRSRSSLIDRTRFCHCRPGALRLRGRLLS